MRFIRYLIPVWLGVFIYVICAVFIGPTGLSAYKQLHVEYQKLLVNKEALKRRNKELENTMNALIDDPATIALYARRLGYAGDDERFIRIVGFSGSDKQTNEPGQILLSAIPEHTSNQVIALFAVCIAVALFLCMLVPDVLSLLQHKPRKWVKPQWGNFF
jgi:cell division protein FtsB